jgi:tetratricopeptide (TPR) repeat protein
MGAQQCIIVRTEIVKKEISLKLPTALVLTVMDSKGMEFDDVLIYNFFSDSKFTRWWLLGSEESLSKYHGFDSKGDHELCSELKMLYVAVTRAKCQLFFIDDSDPIPSLISFWQARELVDFSNLLHFTKVSSAAEWDERGEEFFERKQYDEAIICFKRSKNDACLRKATANQKFDIAESLRAENKNIAARLLYAQIAQDFNLLGDLLKAADCFLKASLPKDAAIVYNRAGSFNKALQVCLVHQLQSEALGFLSQNPDHVESERYARLFASTAHRLKKPRYIMNFLKFVNKAGARSFLIRYKEIDLLYLYDKDNENWNDLAESAELKGLFRIAFESYLKNNEIVRALEIGLKYFIRARVFLNHFSMNSIVKKKCCFKSK